MQIRPSIRLIYQVGRVVVQTAALFLDLDDLSGGRITRGFTRNPRVRQPQPPPQPRRDERGKHVYGTSRGVPLHKAARPFKGVRKN
jgi:hypothetical protein